MRVATRLFLHIGTQKSGTTYLQRILQQLAPDLRERGVLYPVWSTRGREVYNHEPATYGLLGSVEFPWVPQATVDAQRSEWATLVDRVRRWDGPAIVSGEAMSTLRPDAARRIVDALAVTDTTVIITARDLGRVLPSSWQQHIRNGRVSDFGAYISATARGRGAGTLAERSSTWDTDLALTFWRAYAIGTLARRWGGIVGDGRVRVIAVPRPAAGPDALWSLFRAAVEVEALTPATPPPVSTLRANIGLTEPEVVLLSAVNAALQEAAVPPGPARAFRLRLINEVLTTRADRGRPVRLPAEWFDTVAAWSAEDVDVLRAQGSTVYGDIGDLQPARAETASEATDARAVGAAAAAAIVALGHPGAERGTSADPRRKS